MGKTLIVVVVLLVIALVLGSWFMGVRNQIVTKNEAVKAAWSSVDIALQRRADFSTKPQIIRLGLSPKRSHQSLSQGGQCDALNRRQLF